MTKKKSQVKIGDRRAASNRSWISDLALGRWESVVGAF
jgi:hypothetical protein